MGHVVSYLSLDQQYTPETSLEYYKFDGYESINSYLRFPDIYPSFKDHAELHMSNIDKLMKKEVKPVVLYRGYKIFKYFITDKGYSSCTTDINIAKRFGTIIKFRLPDHISFYHFEDDKEDEYLLQRGLKFTILNKIKEDDITVYESEVELL
jgi:hypothetical protein